MRATMTDDERRARSCTRCGEPVGHTRAARRCGPCLAAEQRRRREDEAVDAAHKRRMAAGDKARRALARRHPVEYRELYLAYLADPTES